LDLDKDFDLMDIYAVLDYRSRRRMSGRDWSSTLFLLPSFRRTRQSESLHPLSSQPLSGSRNTYGQDLLGSRNIALTEESHSELGAARDVLRNVWRELQSDGIQLPSGNSQSSRTQTGNLRRVFTAFERRVRRFSDTFSQMIADGVLPLLLSIIFVAIFVAESTSGIFSANIVTDSVALAFHQDVAYIRRKNTLKLPGGTRLH